MQCFKGEGWEQWPHSYFIYLFVCVHTHAHMWTWIEIHICKCSCMHIYVCMCVEARGKPQVSIILGIIHPGLFLILNNSLTETGAHQLGKAGWATSREIQLLLLPQRWDYKWAWTLNGVGGQTKVLMFVPWALYWLSHLLGPRRAAGTEAVPPRLHSGGIWENVATNSLKVWWVQQPHGP